MGENIWRAIVFNMIWNWTAKNYLQTVKSRLRSANSTSAFESVFCKLILQVMIYMYRVFTTSLPNKVKFYDTSSPFTRKIQYICKFASDSFFFFFFYILKAAEGKNQALNWWPYLKNFLKLQISTYDTRQFLGLISFLLPSKYNNLLVYQLLIY